MGISYNPSIIVNNLVVYLDSGNKKSYPGSGNIWTDLSLNKNNTTLVNSPTFISNNLGTLSFNGSTQYGSFVGSANNFGLGSIECWCKCDTPTNNLNQQIVSRTNTSAGTFNLVKNNSNFFEFSIRLTTGIQYKIVSNSVATADWTHLVGTYDGTTQKIYVNATQQSATTNISGLLDTTGTLNINVARDTTGTEYFAGQISIIKLYNRALTSAEILQNFNAIQSRFSI